MVRINLKEEGITLVTLIVTIIILLILAGVTVNIAISNNGIIEKSKYAVKEYKNKKEIEEGELEKYENFLGEFQPEETEKYIGTEWKFDYTGSEQIFIVPYNGKYMLEVWGAQGGNIAQYQGGYGGYSVGKIKLEKGKNLYINVGETGKTVQEITGSPRQGGYNGGGNADAGAGSGGGATHIATEKGLLEQFKNNIENLLIVAGAGGGAKKYADNTGNYSGNGGNGGGYIGGTAVAQTSIAYGVGTGGTQVSGGYEQYINSWNGATYGSFGKGATVFSWWNDGNYYLTGAGGGAGFYGGGSQEHGPAGGGSGYIGNSLLYDRHMAGYNVEASEAETTKTISVANASEEPKADYAKIGNGYAKITYLGN